jgi:hypothetical protein
VFAPRPCYDFSKKNFSATLHPPHKKEKREGRYKPPYIPLFPICPPMVVKYCYSLRIPCPNKKKKELVYMKLCYTKKIFSKNF